MGSKLNSIKEIITNLLPEPGNIETSIKGLRIARRDDPTDFLRCFYHPTCMFVIQGEKQSIFGADTFNYGENQYMISCTDVPVMSRIVEASKQKPCLALILEIDHQDISKLIHETKIPEHKGEKNKYLAVANADEPLMDAFKRLTELLIQPKEQQAILAPMIIKEIYYRILIGPLGQQLKIIHTKGTVSNQIYDAINILKNNYKEKINMEEIAKNVNMAPSSFYRHFKKVTKVSPLQYQKHVRLYEAQKLMLTGKYDSTNASYEVGYESPTQFSREYKKLFGNPPKRDIKKLVSA